ncbi:hypothetical protein LEMLEM_LOCUS27802 [Lemmus lemmus]
MSRDIVAPWNIPIPICKLAGTRSDVTVSSGGHPPPITWLIKIQRSAGEGSMVRQAPEIMNNGLWQY